MFKIAGAIIDQYGAGLLQDPELYKLAAANALLPEDLESCAIQNFAVKIAGKTRVHGYFPVHNKVATLLSLWGFDQTAPNLPEDIVVNAAYHLKVACEKYDIDHAIRKLAFDGPAPDILDYRLIRTDPKLSREALALDLHHKVANFVEEFDMIEPKNRVLLAGELKLLSDTLDEKLAEARVLDYIPVETIGPLFELALSQRTTVLTSRGKTAELVELRTMFKRDEGQKLSAAQCAELLEAFDKTADIKVQRDKVIDPYRAVYGGQDKNATCSPFATYDPWYYKLMSLAYDKELLKKYFTEDFIDRFQRAPQQEYDRADSAVQTKIRQAVDEVVENRIKGTKQNTKDEALNQDQSSLPGGKVMSVNDKPANKTRVD